MSSQNLENIGKKGENVSSKFLMKHGYRIENRNYSKKFGEIDIIASKDGELYFIEVKTSVIKENNENVVSQETSRPEERVTRQKIAKISKVIQIYLEENNKSDSDWHFLVFSVLFNQDKKTATLKIIEDVVPE